MADMQFLTLTSITNNTITRNRQNNKISAVTKATRQKKKCFRQQRNICYAPATVTATATATSQSQTAAEYLLLIFLVLATLCGRTGCDESQDFQKNSEYHFFL